MDSGIIERLNEQEAHINTILHDTKALVDQLVEEQNSEHPPKKPKSRGKSGKRK